MASLKVFFLAFIAFSALINIEASSAPRNVIDDLEKFVEYEKLVEKTINQYLHHLEEIFETVTGTINNELTQAYEETQIVLDQVFKFVAKLQELRGSDYEICFTQQFPKIQQLVKETEIAQAACTEASKQDVDAIKERLNQQLSEINEEVAVLLEEIKKCKDFDCVMETEEEVFEKVEAAKVYVRDAVKEAVKVVKEKSPEAVSCIVAASDNFKSEMKKVLVDVRNCATKA